jgi:ATP-dependent Clp protease ATP-binding subunit ClpA
MAFERFTKDARAAVLSASEEAARSSGQTTLEAEHLLLALAVHPDLRHLGLKHDELVTALEQEEERSLAAVGISASEFELPVIHPRPAKPKLATSAKLALQRAAEIAVGRRERRIRAGHLLQGVLAAERGRVPRALGIAGVDVDQLRAQIGESRGTPGSHQSDA